MSDETEEDPLYPKRKWAARVVSPQVGTAHIAYQALGLTSEDALRKRFSKPKNPWPACLRFKDGPDSPWIYDIERILAYLRGEWKPVESEPKQG